MIEKHTDTSRGVANHGWLVAKHSFSFANYYNPDRMQFGVLRVLNDDVIAPSMGFGEHPHKNMEIITIPLSGTVKHKDNISNDWLSIKENEVQVMSAGSGVYHSEINGSAKEHLKLFQIWIMPNEDELRPRYDQKEFLPSGRKNKLQILVSGIGDAFEGLKIHQKAIIARIDLEIDTTFEYTLKYPQNGIYIMNISGNVIIENHTITTRDALAIWDAKNITIKATATSELLIIEVPKT